MDLVNAIQNLGITQEQARGGLGLIFKTVQEKLGDSDFSKVQEALPQIQALISEAPEEGGGGLLGAIGGIAKSLGVGDLGKLVGVADGFKKLGLDPKMVLQFIPKILEWAQNAGGPQLKAILEKVLK